MNKKNQRQESILSILSADGYVKVSDLSRQFGISEVTIRKDLDELAAQGKIYRKHGNAVLRKENLPGTASEAKAAIGKAAASLIEDGDTVSIGSGTTCMELCRALQDRSNILLVTNSIDVMNITIAYPGFTTFFFGGKVDSSLRLTVGDDMHEQIDKYLIGKLFFGMDGLDLLFGASTNHHEEKDIMRHLMQRAQKRYIVADSTKIGRITFAKIANLDEFDAIITNETDQTRESLLQMEAAGIRIIRA